MSGSSEPEPDGPDDLEEPGRPDAGGGSGDQRSGHQLLFDGVFGPFFWAQMLSTIGIWVNNITAAILVFELTRSALLVGLVSVAQFAPQILLGPWSGAQADRGDRRRQIVLGRVISALGSAGLAGAILAGVVDEARGAAAVIVAAGVVGVGYAVGSPALHAVLPALVRPGELPAAVALNSLPFTIGRAVGPAVGALLAATLGAAAAFGLAATAHLVFAAVIARLAIRSVHRPRGRDDRIRAALHHIVGDRPTLRLLLGVTTIGIGADPVITLTPSVAASLGGGAALVGALASAFGVGAGAAHLVLGRFRARFGLARTGVSGLALFAGSTVLLGLATDAELALLALGLGGIGMTFALTAHTTLIQQRVPEEFRGRVMALWSVAYLGSRPLAAASNGAVADALTPTVALFVVAAVLSGGALLTRPSRLER